MPELFTLRNGSAVLIREAEERDAPALAFHPCDNTLTAAMAGRDFFDIFLPSLEISPIDVEIHDFLD